MFMKKSSKMTVLGIIISALILAPLFLSTHTSQADNEIIWGVDYSQSQAESLGLNPEETYSAIINDLGAKQIKIHIDWDATEQNQGVYNFTTLDKQVHLAEIHKVNLILVIGMKTGRWPECHTPTWFEQLPEDQRQAALISYVDTIVARYKYSPAVQYWQVENEPFLEFGTCPAWYYKQGTSRLEAEIATVRAQDPSRKIIVSESGELSDWTKAAKMADIVGVTMYRSSWNQAQKTFGINPYSFLMPEFYSTKAKIIRQYYNKPVISIELQAEPWTAKPLNESSLDVQAKSMNPELFKENVAFAKEAGLGTYYFWGAEWWYWMKTKQNQPEIWNEAKTLFAK